MTDTLRLEPMFARHETFAPRVGWFKKIYDGVRADPDVFLREDATLTLGVGKNMVRSMRFWAGAAGITTPRRISKKEQLRPSHFAETILADDGWDPFLENASTLWLLHWRLLSNGCQLPVWHYAFSDLTLPEFSVPLLTSEAVKALATAYGFEREVAASSVRRDVECLIHTYSRRSSDKTLLDDSLACPFRSLGLIEAVPARAGLYRFSLGAKPTLADDIVLYAALDFSSIHAPGSHSVSLGRLARSPMSPGRVFKLDEDSLLEALTRASQERSGITVVDTAGVSAVQFAVDPATLATRILNSHYHSESSRLVRSWDEVAPPDGGKARAKAMDV